MTAADSAPPAARAVRPLHWLLAGFLAVTLAYAQGLPGLFLHDDFANIVSNRALQVDTLAAIDVEAVSAIQPSRPLAMLSFAANHAVCGMSPACFKVTNLALHLACGAALFLLLRMLFRLRPTGLPFAPDTVAAAVTVFWLAHPLNVSTVLYVVQRMTILSTLAVLVALAAWLHFREAPARRWPALLAAIAAVGTGLLAKETALLAIPLVVLVEILLRRPPPRMIAAGAVLMLAAVALLLLLYRERIAVTYEIRDYTLGERLMTEARVLWFYLSELVFPLPHRMSLFLDGMPVSRGLLSPATTLPAIIGIIALLAVAAWHFVRHASFVAFGVLFFFTGHLLESTVWGLEIAYEHRNYLGGIGILLAATLAVAQVSAAPRAMRVAAVAASITLVALLAVRANTWSSLEGMATDLARSSPDSPRAQQLIGGYWRREWIRAAGEPARAPALLAKARSHYRVAVNADPRAMSPLVALLELPGASPGEEADLWALLQHRARNERFTADTVNGVLTMAICVLGEACHYPPRAVDGALDSLLANPTLNAGARTRVKHVAGAFKVRAMHDVENGLALSLDAARLGPPRYRVTHLENLVAAGRREDAAALYREIQADTRLTPADRDKALVAMREGGMRP